MKIKTTSCQTANQILTKGHTSLMKMSLSHTSLILARLLLDLPLPEGLALPLQVSQAAGGV